MTDNQEASDKIGQDVTDLIGMFGDVISAVQALPGKAHDIIKDDIDMIADEAQAKEMLKERIIKEINAILPLSVAEIFVTSRLPGLVHLMAGILGQGTIDGIALRIETDAVGVAVDLIVGEIEKLAGSDWFAKLKSKI